ncbi:MAG TPA: hypothetical protein VGD78_02160 [Chthoniobacterales bacterium]
MELAIESPQSMKIYLGNLSFHTGTKNLEKVLGQLAGRALTVNVARSKEDRSGGARAARSFSRAGR